jgi:hypothetical protein
VFADVARTLRKRVYQAKHHLTSRESRQRKLGTARFHARGPGKRRLFAGSAPNGAIYSGGTMPSVAVAFTRGCRTNPLRRPLATLGNVTAPIDSNQPGAIRLRELARRIRADFVPVNIDAREPIWLLDEDRLLQPGDRAAVPARTAEALIKQGSATRA